MKFQFECVDAEGKKCRGTVNADSEEAAAAKVESKGLALTSIDLFIEIPPRPPGRPKPAPQRRDPPSVTFASNQVRGRWPVTLLLVLGALMLVAATFLAIASTADRSDSSATDTASNQTQQTSVASDAEPEWWTVGTLTGKTALEWQDASPENKLATCAGLIALVFKNYPERLTILGDHKPSEATPDHLRPYAEKLVVFIDDAFEENPDPSQQIAKAAVVGMASLNLMLSDNEVIAEKLRLRLRVVESARVEVIDYFDDPSQKIVKVHWEIGNNLTEGMVRSSAQIDIVEILKVARESELVIRELTAFGSFPMTDKLGSVSNDVVVKASYTGDTLNKIQFENFLFQNVYDISDSVWLHPAFREQ